MVIRVADMAEWYGWKLQATPPADDVVSPQTFGGWIAEAHKWCAWTWTAIRLDRPHYLSRLLGHIEAMAAHYGIDLDTAIEAKMEYNRTRSYRHGGKAL